MNERFNVGDIVLSTAGHDAGMYFAVLSVEGGFADIANGKLRKVEKPKRKKLKHLKNTGCTYEELVGVQFDKDRITNPALKKAVSALKNRDL